MRCVALNYCCFLIKIANPIQFTTMFDISGKVALVTGALGGIGRAYVKALLKNKLKLAVLLDINENAAADFLEELSEAFGRDCAWFIKTDVADFTQLEGAFKQTVERFGQLDIVINNAGVGEFDALKCAQINFVSVVIGTKLAFETYLPKYKEGEEGVIVNTSSVSGLKASEFIPVYSATKQGIVTLGRCFGSPTNKIKIITLCPGATDTSILELIPKELEDFIKGKSSGNWKQKPEHVGEALIKVLEEGKSGSVWIVDNGNPAKEIDFRKSDEIIANQILDAPSSGCKT